MSTCRLVKNGEVLVETVEWAVRLGARMKGLLGRSGLPHGCGLYLAPCGSIHTFGMRFSIDLVFFDRSLHVCRIVRDVRPNRMVMGGWRARSVLELATGWFPEGALAVGDGVSLLTDQSS